MKQLLLFALLLTTTLLSGCTNNVPLTSTSWLASAAIAAVVSAVVAGFVSVYIKQKEYENEYFKKVIEKRLKAIESMEDATAPLRLHRLTKKSDGTEIIFHLFFTLSDGPEAFRALIAAASKYTIWHSTPTAKAFGVFTRQVTHIRHQCSTLNEAECQELAATEFKAVNETMSKLTNSISQDMLRLHKVEEFLRNRLKQFDKLQTSRTRNARFERWRTMLKTFVDRA
jgi:hypothetical protein